MTTMNYQPLHYIYTPTGDKTAHTLLLLHGTGGDENDLLPVARPFGAGLNILSLRGNVSEGGMPRFFKRLGMGIFDEQDLIFRTHEMVTFIKELAVKESFDPSRIIALGYSNGANIAGSALVLYPGFLAGAILFRPMQPFKIIGGGWKDDKHTPVFMSNGASDPTIDQSDTRAYADILKKGGYEVSSVSLPVGHQLSQQDLTLALTWYKDHFPDK